MTILREHMIIFVIGIVFLVLGVMFAVLAFLVPSGSFIEDISLAILGVLLVIGGLGFLFLAWTGGI